jgi:hypothetical protein
MTYIDGRVHQQKRGTAPERAYTYAAQALFVCRHACKSATLRVCTGAASPAAQAVQNRHSSGDAPRSTAVPAPASRSAARHCRTESLLSERTEALPASASGGAPRGPPRSACGSAYFTCVPARGTLRVWLGRVRWNEWLKRVPANPAAGRACPRLLCTLQGMRRCGAGPSGAGARLEPLAGAGRALHAVELLERRRGRLRGPVADVCKALRRTTVSRSIVVQTPGTSQQQTQDRSLGAAACCLCPSAVLARARRAWKRASAAAPLPAPRDWAAARRLDSSRARRAQPPQASKAGHIYPSIP